MDKVGKLLAGLRTFLAEVRIEMSKVSWPSREQVKMYTIVTLVSSVAVSLLIGAWDILLGRVVQYLLGLSA